MAGINETKQEFLGVDVDEVSLVDTPANEEEWLVVKRLDKKTAINTEAAAPPQSEVDTRKAVWPVRYINDLPDSAFLYVESGGKKDEDGKTVPRSLRHFPYKDTNGKVDLPHLRNAIARIPQAKIPGLSQDDLAKLQDKARKLLEKERGKQEAKKMAVKDDKNIKKSGEEAPAPEPETAPEPKSEPELEIETVKTEPETPPAPEVTSEPESEPVAKSVIAVSENGEIAIDTALIQKITKAKTFSKGRTATLESATKAMIALLKEVAPEAVQKLTGGITEGDASTQKAIEADGKPKAEQSDLAEAITTAVTKAIEPLNTRIKDLEGAKATPKSTDGDQQAEIKKSNTNIWAGSALS